MTVHKLLRQPLLSLAAATVLLALAAWSVAGTASLTNSAGVTAELVTAEADSGATLANTAGAILEVATTDQTGIDSSVTGSTRLSLGLIDPLDAPANAARCWALYD